jgi:D-alanine-D-alanine ligase
MRKNVILLVGGWNAEREVSITKGKVVEDALRAGGYTVTVIDVTKDIAGLVAQINAAKPDAIFNNIYGRMGEDGAIQGLCELMEIPYTCSGILASAINMDKPMAKLIAATVGVKSPRGMLVTCDEVLSEKLLPRPYVIKPYNEGSSVGVLIVKDGDNHLANLKSNWMYGDKALMEEYIPGRELTVAVLDGKAQAVSEIVSHTGFFDYEAKYHDTRTEIVLPAKIPQDVYDLALRNAEKVYAAIGCHGLARCDFRFDETRGVDGLYFLEINNPPGLTPESIGPSQCVYNGLSFIQLCSHLVETAKCHGRIQPHAAPAAQPSSTVARAQQRA